MPPFKIDDHASLSREKKCKPRKRIAEKMSCPIKFNEIGSSETDLIKLFRTNIVFCISVTFEMRTSEYIEICISIDETIAEQAFKRNGKMGKESKVAERQREIECVCASVDQNR